MLAYLYNTQVCIISVSSHVRNASPRVLGIMCVCLFFRIYNSQASALIPNPVIPYTLKLL